MLASKEHAAEALKVLRLSHHCLDSRTYDILHNFIEAAKSRLPTLKAIEKDKRRPKKAVAS